MTTTLTKNVFQFLNQLEQNNDRDWFNAHKDTFKSIEKEVKQFNTHVFNLLNTHDDVDKLKLFRIYRDVRFSKNKQPYKTHFGCSFNRVKPKLRGGYYIHIQPNNQSFIATGFWDPNKDDLFRIRKEFEMDDEDIRAILKDKEFASIWGNFKGDELKTAPKGFDKSHPAIDLIRRKQFIFTKEFSDQEVLSPDFITTIDQAFKAIRPFFDLMSDILTTDLNGQSIID
ncbi:hypothetical protein C7H62_2466 [Mesoflavibacter sp. HG96]|uniref:DUF2461 domain-containing protein n=1 Tax=Mesoflavibacter profundi TaxID=2708110 RepID=A0ABT4RXS1_9FLAO|nr:MULTISPECIES: DUF2461 domain-containing protein [Mesoflavibacter]MDA0176617.1 DUF2461 domain-containing protein [Mesoflavibacter profundi]QIJ90274.1 hypothetical protein C7H62_2466 [Mesoflavibacter sp. HG96]QIJ93002.1 hypothetical protein C7H56_2466 [Mesoflavibacter sp. HG37]